MLAALLLCGMVSASAAAPSAGGTVPGAEEKEKATKLEALRRTIKELRTSLDQARGKQAELRGQLRDSEVSIGSLTQSLKKLKKELTQKDAELRGLRARRDEANVALEHQRRILAQQILAGYAMGREGHMKIILSQQEPSSIGRMLTYYDYLNRARADRIGEIDHRLAEISVLEHAIAQQAETLEQLHGERTQQLQALRDSRASRRQVLVKLGGEIKGKQQKLEVLLQDERNLSELLIKLRRALAEIPAERPSGPGDSGPFARHKGKLSWPARGKITARYGAARQVGSLTWRGVIIGAEEGVEVKAIYRGRVAFADWLRGFGLLIIVDHGDGYMSLYGQNQSVAKNVGDWVERGETIATVGNSGGQDSAGLYFEIRHNGVPDNPVRWCRADKR
ncbi:MAG: peptidoglycan DD-metalloendopeptidase family protein [Gammaproteobacteria bacterium]|nr:peptidoglycan DD-metalloendopeptidase family protein [Gammaproteobacteria bacterium]